MAQGFFFSSSIILYVYVYTNLLIQKIKFKPLILNDMPACLCFVIVCDINNNFLYKHLFSEIFKNAKVPAFHILKLIKFNIV